MMQQDDSNNLTPLSPSESEILQILWKLGKATVQQVCDALPADRQIAYPTVQTLLRRLHKKGYIAPSQKGRAHVFSPTARQDDVIRSTVGDFVKRLFGGNPGHLMLHLADEAELSDTEIERIKNLLDKHKDQ